LQVLKYKISKRQYPLHTMQYQVLPYQYLSESAKSRILVSQYTKVLAFEH